MEVARLLLDSGAQVNMPADSFESPLTLAACGGHVELAALLIERGANLEEVNDEGYTPLMEAAREGHEEMVALLLAQGKSPAPLWARAPPPYGQEPRPLMGKSPAPKPVVRFHYYCRTSDSNITSQDLL